MTFENKLTLAFTFVSGMAFGALLAILMMMMLAVLVA